MVKRSKSWTRDHESTMTERERRRIKTQREGALYANARATRHFKCAKVEFNTTHSRHTQDTLNTLTLVDRHHHTSHTASQPRATLVHHFSPCYFHSLLGHIFTTIFQQIPCHYTRDFAILVSLANFDLQP